MGRGQTRRAVAVGGILLRDSGERSVRSDAHSYREASVESRGLPRPGSEPPRGRRSFAHVDFRASDPGWIGRRLG